VVGVRPANGDVRFETEKARTMSRKNLLHHLRLADRGAVAGEYAVLLTVIAVLLVTAIGIWLGALEAAVDGAAGVIDGL